MSARNIPEANDINEINIKSNISKLPCSASLDNSFSSSKLSRDSFSMPKLICFVFSSIKDFGSILSSKLI